MRRRYALAVLFAAAGTAAADDRFNDLTFYLPPQANAAAVIDVQGLYASPLAQKGKWAAERPLPVPPTIANAAIGCRIEPGSLTGGQWEVAVARMRARLTIDQIGEREKGAVENIAGSPAVLSPRNAYFVEIQSPWIFGMMRPADRQDLGRWLRDVRNSPIGVVRLAPFLKASVTNVDPKAQFVLAIDTTDVVSPEAAHKDLAAAPALAGKPAETAAVAKALGTMHGVKLTLRVTDAIHGELRFEFTEPAAPLVPWAKPLLTGFLAHRGASVEAIEDWKAVADGNSLVLTGDLAEKGLRRVLSLVAPTAPPGTLHDNPLAPEIKALATVRYFRTIETYLDDLQKPSKQTQQDYTKFATWYDSFAQKVEQQPTYSVDEDVVRYGKTTAARLQGIAASLRGDVVDVDKLEKTITVTPYIYATSGWGRRLQPGVWLQSNQAEVQAKQQAAIERGTQVRQDLWSRIENETGAMRQTLAGRYKAN
jgi:hypothetical protein